MPRHGVAKLMDTVQNPAGYVPFHEQSSLAVWSYGSDRMIFLPQPVQKAKSSNLIITGVTTTQDDYVKQLMSLVDLAHSYSVPGYIMSTLVDKPNVLEHIIVQPPEKRVLASIRVRLSSKDLKRRLPRPVISLGPEVEP